MHYTKFGVKSLSWVSCKVLISGLRVPLIVAVPVVATVVIFIVVVASVVVVSVAPWYVSIAIGVRAVAFQRINRFEAVNATDALCGVTKLLLRRGSVLDAVGTRYEHRLDAVGKLFARCEGGLFLHIFHSDDTSCWHVTVHCTSAMTPLFSMTGPQELLLWEHIVNDLKGKRIIFFIFI